MPTLTEFKKLRDAEEFLEFFSIPYEPRVLGAKRFHILRKFGEMIAQIPDQGALAEEKLLEFYRFALLRVYKDFESGYAPSAAEVWGMFSRAGGCGGCSTLSTCSPDLMGGCETQQAFS